MPDSINVFDALWRLTDANGDPVSGGYLEFYQAGSTTPLTVYSDAILSTALGTTVYVDSGGAPVASSGSSTKVLVYVGTTDYKIVAKDSNGSTLGTFDNNPGALDTSTFGTGTGSFELPVVTGTTISETTPRLHNRDVTGGSEVVSLPSAITVGDGYLVGWRHNALGSSNTLALQTVAGQHIKEGASATLSAIVLKAYGETVWLVSDGANWTVWAHVHPLIRDGRPIVIADRLTAAPASPVAGARYIVNGTPTGTWLSLGYQQHDILEANGIGGWNLYRPATDCGWIAYVQDENLHTAFVGTAWADWSNITAPAATALGVFIVEDQKSNGTAGGSATSGSRQTRTLNTSVTNTITDASLASNQVTLPAGKYLVMATAPFSGTGDTQLYFKSTTTSTELYSNVVQLSSGSTAYVDDIQIDGYLSLSAAETFELQYQCTNGTATSGLGQATSFTASGSALERYSRVVIIKLDSVQGPQGAAGAQGNTGRDAGIGRWSFSTTTTSGTSSGQVRFNSGTIGSVTTIYLNETDADSRALSGLLDTLDDSSSTVKATLTFTKQDTPGTFAIFQLTAQSDTGTERELTVTYVAGALPSASDSLCLQVSRTGDAGSGGGGGGVSSVAVSGGTTGLTVTGSPITSSGTITLGGTLAVANGGTGATTASGARSNLGLAIGTDVQAYDADLASWAGVTRASGFDTFAATPSSANLRSLLTDETGSGSAVFATSPSLTTPAIAGSTGTGVHDYGGATSFEIPNGTTVTVDAAGEVAIDTNTDNANITQGSITYYDGTRQMWVIAVDALPSTDGHVLTYDGVAKKFGFEAAPGAGGGLSNAYATITDGTNTANSSGGDTFKIRTGTGLTATVGNDDATHGDNVLFSLASALQSWSSVTRASGFDTFATTPSSSNLAALVTDETGTGALVFATSPTLTTPTLGVATATSVNKVAITAPATSATLTIADGKTLTLSNTLTFTGTDGSSVAFGSGGTVNLAGVNEWFIPASSFVPRTSNGCAALATLETTTNKVNLDHLAFDATTQEFAQCVIPRMPKSWNESVITAIPIWSHPSTTTNFGVVWGVSGVALSDDDAADTAFGTAQTSTDTGGTTDDVYHGPATSSITIGGTPAEGDTVVLQVSRNPSDASDTLAVDARLHGLLLRITTNAANDA